ncbi:MAG: hypothetical protein DCC67_11860 [Planctomycetota bacterium]|nr:MAG: hypothetical protein DCC67_11860 [Planctomycetota bacterium]
MEGRTVRNTWYAAWAVAGLAASGMFGGAAAVRAARAAAPTAPTLAGEQQPSWTDKMKAPFAKMGAAFKKATVKRPAEPYEPPFDANATSPELYVAMAQMSHRGGNVANARLLYQKAIAKDPKNLDALLGAARMEDREGNLDIAASLYQRALQAHPTSATAFNDLGLCLARRGDVAGAQAALDQAVRLAPEKPLYRNNIAKVLIELNRLDAAQNHLLAVHSPATAHYNMAVLLAERGRHAEASEQLAAALAIDPSMAPAQQMLAQRSGGVPAEPRAADPRAVAQSPPRLSLPAAEGSDSILPTPQIVATIPWRAPDSADVAAPQLPPERSDRAAPTLLPPTN